MSTKHTKSQSKVLIILLSLTILLTSNKISLAQEDGVVSVGTTPTAQYLNLELGEVYQGEFVAWNKQANDTVFELYVSGFKQLEDYPGTSIPLTPEENKEDPYSASSWFTTETEEVLLPSNVNIKIPYTITVPTDLPDGVYRAKLYLSTDNPDLETYDVKTITDLAAGPSFLITIGEDLEEKLEFTNSAESSFRTDQKLYVKPDVEFTTELNNIGDTFLTPQGEIIVSNMFGDEVARINFNDNSQSLLPKNLAKYTNEWTSEGGFFEEGKPLIGRMEAKLLLTYTSENPGYSPLTAVTTFWIIPWKHLLVLLLVIVVTYKIITSNKNDPTVKVTKV